MNTKKEVEDALKILPASGAPPHIFADIAFDLIPEIDYLDMLYVSRHVTQLGLENLYSSLADSLRKMQCAKLAGLEALRIEKGIEGKASSALIPFDPIGQAQYSKALFDFIAHSKSSLDSLAIFLNDLLGTDRSEGARDFRQLSFRNAVCSKNSSIRSTVKKLANWFDKDCSSSDSLVATRDEWLHRGSPHIVAMYPPNEMGYFPIQRDLKANTSNLAITRENFWTSKEFVQFHYDRLVELFKSTTAICASMLKARANQKVDRGALPRTPLSIFAMRGTAQTTPRQYSIRKFVPLAFDANQLWEELPQKLLKMLSPREADDFARVARHRVFDFNNRESCFVFASGGFLEKNLGIAQDTIRSLERCGLLIRSDLGLSKGSTYICEPRGFRVDWPDNDARILSVVLLTRAGQALASLVKTECDQTYMQESILLLNSNQVNVALLAVSDVDQNGYRYDSLGTFRYSSM